MTDLAEPTAEPNSTQTDAAVTTEAPAQPGSTTTPPSDAPADPLDGGTILGDAGEKPEGEEVDKPADGDAVEGEPKEPEAPTLTGAPEGDYDLTGLLPEGTAVDADALGKITPIAKELNLSSAGLAKIAAEGLPIVTKQVTDGIIGEVVAQRKSWETDTRAAILGGKNSAGEEVQADPIFAGKSFEDVTTMSAKALDRFGGAGFREFLQSTGLGNHPQMVRFAFNAGSAISEDNDFARGDTVPTTPKSREEKYYGSNG